MHWRKDFQSWRRVEQDMRAAGYPEAVIRAAQESYCQGMDLIRRILQRISSNDVIEKPVSRTAGKSV